MVQELVGSYADDESNALTGEEEEGGRAASGFGASRTVVPGEYHHSEHDTGTLFDEIPDPADVGE